MAAEWGVEWFRVIFTGAFAFGGAFGGYYLADRGRKQDLLYKESFSAFKSMSAELLKLRLIALQIFSNADLIRTEPPLSDTDKFQIFALKQRMDSMGEIVQGFHLSRLNWIFLQTDVRDHIEYIVNDAGELIVYSLYIYTQSGVDENLNYPKETSFIIPNNQELKERAMSLRKHIEAVINIAYKDLELPDFQPLFGRTDLPTFITLPREGQEDA